MKMSSQLLYARLVTASALRFLSFCAAVGAPTVETASAQTVADTDEIDEIVVTARRKQESLYEVPVAVTALSAESLIEQGVRSELDLQSAVPGFLAREVGDPSTVSLSVRGQSIDGYSSSPPAVLPYINDFQVTNLGASTFFDLESVQVLKGPQGTLFGRNTTGGAVLYTTKQPGDRFEGDISGRYGSFESVQVQGGVTVPIVQDRASIRIAGSYKDGGGFVKNRGYYENTSFAGGAPATVAFVPRNETLGDVENISGRLTLALDVTDWLRNTTTAQYSRDDGTHTPGVAHSQLGSPYAHSIFNIVEPTDGPFQGPNALGQNSAWQRGTNEETYTNLSADLRARSELFINTTEIDLGATLQIKNITGYYKNERNTVFDLDGTGFALYGSIEFFEDTTFGLGERGAQHNIDEIYSNELQLLGTALDDRLDFIVGLYYANAKHLDDAHLQFFGGAIPPYKFETRDQSYAVFGQATYRVTKDVRVTGGVRLSKDDIDGHQLPGGFFSPPIFGGFPPDVAATFEQDQKVSFDEPSWTLGVDYQVTPELLLYVTQRGSWRAGGLNFPAIPRTYDGTGAVTPDNPNGFVGNVFEPEKTRDVEFGAKFNGEIGGVRVAATGAMFYQLIEDVQRTAFVLVQGAPGLVTINVPEAEIVGQEFSLTMTPVDWLTFGGQLTHLDSRYTDGQVFAAGTRLVYGPYGDVPDWSGAVFVEATNDFQDGSSISVRGDLFAQSQVAFANYVPPASGDTTIPGYGLLNGRLSWNDIRGSRFSAALYGKNILDKQWYAGGIPTQGSIGVNVVSPGRPQEFGIELQYRF